MPKRKKPTLTLVPKSEPRRKAGRRRGDVHEENPPAPAVGRNDLPDFIEGRLDLNSYLIKHPAATFYVRVSGDSMTGVGASPGCILVADRAVEAANGDCVIARLKDQLIFRRLRVEGGRTLLVAENPAYKPEDITNHPDCDIWARVMFVIREL